MMAGWILLVQVTGYACCDPGQGQERAGLGVDLNHFTNPHF